MTLMDSPRRVGGYPQSLWISVWMTQVRKPRQACRNMTLSNCSLFRQGISSCFLNGLRMPADIFHVILSSTWGCADNRSRVCITLRRTPLRERFSKKILWRSSHGIGTARGAIRCFWTCWIHARSTFPAGRSPADHSGSAARARSVASAPAHPAPTNLFAAPCRWCWPRP
jgi:hypothetical protein